MNLLVRINLALAAAFALAALAVGGTSYSMLRANAKREALQEAGLMMDSVLSMRAYASEEIVTLLSTQMTKDFLPESEPSTQRPKISSSCAITIPSTSAPRTARRTGSSRSRAWRRKSILTWRVRNSSAPAGRHGQHLERVGRSCGPPDGA
jgi:hypothetical protein